MKNKYFSIIIGFVVLTLTIAGCAPQSRAFEELQGKTTVPEQPDPIPTPIAPEFQDPEFTIVGHRGARAIYPQNTLPSFDYAIKVESDQIEFDTQFTADNVIVINHDAYIDGTRCLDSKGKKIPNKKFFIRQMTLAQVQSYDCGTLQDKGVPQHPVPGAKIPTLDELIQFVLVSKHPKAATVVFKFDIKYEEKTPQYWPSPSEIAKRILEKVYAYGIQNRSEYSAFEPRVLEELRKLDSKAKLAYLVGAEVNQKALDKSLELGVKTFSPHILGLTLKGLAKWTKKFQDKGIQMIPYTVNKESDWKKLLNAKAAGIITDDPEGLRAYYNTHKTIDNGIESTEELEEQEMEVPEGFEIPEEEL